MLVMNKRRSRTPDLVLETCWVKCLSFFHSLERTKHLPELVNLCAQKRSKERFESAEEWESRKAWGVYAK